MTHLEKIISSAVNDKNLDAIISDLFVKKGIKVTAVMGMKFTAESEDHPLGFALGIQLFDVFPIGLIFISDHLCNSLSKEEAEFVVAHEIGHIMLNHLVISASLAFTKEIFITTLLKRSSLTREEAENIVGGIKLLSTIISKQTTIEEQITAQKELDADKYAVYLQGRREPAFSCLTKLSSKSILGISHITKNGLFEFPALTFAERIRAIEVLRLI
ncbi:MAG: hypothetical protein COT45_01210 [bacterium (Candidatus Stahlbacteria) CG08_land_8_20_14_0_20_40_26]|nr:MAG: hypothetical protein COX49_01945 [bacterium (Candidatus Stahlbacteria) CG23_combo_of_CG06-09_8_20_14_all_40_9]PIS26112.1 MAG: hypothetical protein COT45_01210 [bacterium (Candidatus Stahlbacteria) CG08_land_8_20_14_0_20_40_26]